MHPVKLKSIKSLERQRLVMYLPECHEGPEGGRGQNTTHVNMHPVKLKSIKLIERQRLVIYLPGCHEGPERGRGQDTSHVNMYQK